MRAHTHTHTHIRTHKHTQPHGQTNTLTHTHNPHSDNLTLKITYTYMTQNTYSVCNSNVLFFSLSSNAGPGSPTHVKKNQSSLSQQQPWPITNFTASLGSGLQAHFKHHCLSTNPRGLSKSPDIPQREERSRVNAAEPAKGSPSLSDWSTWLMQPQWKEVLGLWEVWLNYESASCISQRSGHDSSSFHININTHSLTNTHTHTPTHTHTSNKCYLIIFAVGFFFPRDTFHWKRILSWVYRTWYPGLT